MSKVNLSRDQDVKTSAWLWEIVSWLIKVTTVGSILSVAISVIHHAYQAVHPFGVVESTVILGTLLMISAEIADSWKKASK